MDKNIYQLADEAAEEITAKPRRPSGSYSG